MFLGQHLTVRLDAQEFLDNVSVDYPEHLVVATALVRQGLGHPRKLDDVLVLIEDIYNRIIKNPSIDQDEMYSWFILKELKLRNTSIITNSYNVDDVVRQCNTLEDNDEHLDEETVLELIAQGAADFWSFDLSDKTIIRASDNEELGQYVLDNFYTDSEDDLKNYVDLEALGSDYADNGVFYGSIFLQG